MMLDQPSATETLENLLSKVRLETAFYFTVSANAPWATLTPHMQNIGKLVMPDAQTILPFHIMLEGEAWCWRVDAPEDKRPFKSGDILLLPNGCDHVIASGRDPETVAEPDIEIYREAEKSQRPCTYVDLGGYGAKANFVCGYFGAPRQTFHPLFASLPELLVLTPDHDKWQALKQLIAIATQQQEDRKSGGRLVASRLAETMFVDTIQQHFLSLTSIDGQGWINALRDTRIGAALNAFHRRPTEPWTIAQLADSAGMSRSAFIERFSELVGLPPIQYVQRWRLQIAANLLAQSDQSIGQIAEACGYSAETSFHRAFKQQTGCTPGAWRRLHAPG